MQKSQLQSKKIVNPEDRAQGTNLTLVPKSSSAASESASAVPVAELPGLVKQWLQDGHRRNHSQLTLDLRNTLLNRLIWFLNECDAAYCDREEIRELTCTPMLCHF